MKVLVLRLNARKSVLSPLQRTTYLGVVWVSTTMQARTSPARIESILTAVRRVKEDQSLTVKQFQRLLGLMAAASNVIPIGLLYMRPLEWWLKTKGFSPRGNPLRMIKVMRRCLRALDMWKQPWFLCNASDGRVPHQLGSGHEWSTCWGVVAISHGTSIVGRGWLLPGVLARVRRDEVSLLLVAPFWPGRVWFSDLIALLDGSPWKIPVRRDLLSQAGVYHPRPEMWKLWGSP